MEKNFEKLSIEEMSLVSGGGDFFGASPCAWAAGTLGGALGGVYGAAVGFAVGNVAGAVAGMVWGLWYGNAFAYGLCS